MQSYDWQGRKPQGWQPFDEFTRPATPPPPRPDPRMTPRAFPGGSSGSSWPVALIVIFLLLLAYRLGSDYPRQVDCPPVASQVGKQ